MILRKPDTDSSDARPTPPGKRSDAIYGVLHAHITEGKLEEGLVLTETAIARAFGTSRSPAASALQRLAEEKLITDFDGRGYLVGAAANVPVRRELADAGLIMSVDELDDLQQRGWRDRLYPLVEREVAASKAFGPFQIVGSTLAEHFGVSRTVASEVLTRLERVGLVQQGANGRWYVPRLTSRDVEEHFQVRTVLEPIALVEGAARCSPDVLRDGLAFARKIYTRDGASTSEQEIVKLEHDLHRDVVLACENSQFRHIIERSQLPLIATHLSFERYLNNAEIRVSAYQHVVIFEALLADDMSAARLAMHNHLTSALAGTLMCLEAGIDKPTSRIPAYLTSV